MLFSLDKKGDPFLLYQISINFYTLTSFFLIIWMFFTIALNVAYCDFPENDFIPKVIDASEKAFLLDHTLSEYDLILLKEPQYEVYEVVIKEEAFKSESIKNTSASDSASSSSYSSDYESNSHSHSANSNPNSNSDSSSSSSDSELHLRDPNVILEEFYAYRSRGSSEDEIRRLSLEYVENLIPTDFWATSKDEITNRNLGVNAYLSQFIDGVFIDNNEEVEVNNFLSFNASLVTKNYHHAYPGLEFKEETTKQIYLTAIENLKNLKK